MDKKRHGMPPSTLYLQSTAERRDHLIGRIDKMLGGYERQGACLSAWQSDRLTSAIDLVTEGLLDLATSELDALAERPASTDTGGRMPITGVSSSAQGEGPLTLSQLRIKSSNLCPSSASSNSV